MFWVLAGALSLLALALVMLPAWRRSGATSARDDYHRAIYKDQLAEIARDLDRGVLSAEQARAARLEVERRLLASDGRQAPAPAKNAPPFALAAVGSVAIAGAALVYVALGSPHLPDRPVAERVPAGAPADFAVSAERLAARLEANPNDADGWMLLARTQAVLERYRAAAESYRRAMALTGNRADAAAGYGEMLVLSSNGTVTPAARDAFAIAVAKDPGNVPARYYLAVLAAQAGRPGEAIEAWRKLEAEAPPDAPWRASLRQKIEETARAANLAAPEAPRGPSAGDIAAAQRMSPEDRQAMIRGMVEGLAARLEETPDDAAGWRRLGRAYGVLGEKAKAEAALARVAALRPDDKEALLEHARALLELAGGADPRTKLPDRFVASMKRVAALDPQDTEALWYLGLAAAQERRKDEAVGHWGRLLAMLPRGSDDAKMVQDALDALKAN